MKSLSFRAYGEEGQAGGGGRLCPNWKPRETFIMHIFVGACVIQTNPSGKRIHERASNWDGMRTCRVVPSICPGPADLRGFLSNLNPDLALKWPTTAEISQGKSHYPSLKQSMHFRTHICNPGLILWHDTGNQKGLLLG